MKIAVWEPARAGRYPAHARATLPAVKAVAGVQRPEANVDRAVQSRSRSISTDCHNESFRFPVCLSDRTRIYRRASMDRCSFSKPARVVEAVVVDKADPAAVNSCVIVSAIDVQTPS